MMMKMDHVYLQACFADDFRRTGPWCHFLSMIDRAESEDFASILCAIRHTARRQRDAGLLSDHPVESRVGDEGHDCEDLLERLCTYGCLEVLWELPLRDIDETELRRWVYALVELGREKARRASRGLVCFAPRLGADPSLKTTYQLVQDLLLMRGQREGERLDAWLTQVHESHFSERKPLRLSILMEPSVWI
jgi:hypothetical protein